MKIKQITDLLEKFAPLALQEHYDNSGLIVGNPEKEISKVLICLDVTGEVLEEAVKLKAGLIISHHPLIFKGLKRLTEGTNIERLVTKAIKNEIAIYAIHTNLDNIFTGVNLAICEKLELKNCRVLQPGQNLLKKLVTFCPDIRLADGTYVPDAVRKALFDAGGGYIGNYDSCSFNMEGTGTFRGLEDTMQFIGKKFEITEQKEIRVETIFPSYLQKNIIKALLEAHPYEEVAYDIYPLSNTFEKCGSGMIGELASDYDENEFLKLVKDQLQVKMLRHSRLRGKKIKIVAVCGGAGSFLISEAVCQNADVFVTADLKYHDFFEAEEGIMLVDAGHYETEQFSINLLFEFLTKIFPNFAFQKISFNSNPINYL